LRSPGTDAQHDLLRTVAPPPEASRWLRVLRKKLSFSIQTGFIPAHPDPFFFVLMADVYLPGLKSLKNLGLGQSLEQGSSHRQPNSLELIDLDAMHRRFAFDCSSFAHAISGLNPMAQNTP